MSGNLLYQYVAPMKIYTVGWDLNLFHHFKMLSLLCSWITCGFIRGKMLWSTNIGKQIKKKVYGHFWLFWTPLAFKGNIWKEKWTPNCLLLFILKNILFVLWWRKCYENTIFFCIKYIRWQLFWKNNWLYGPKSGVLQSLKGPNNIKDTAVSIFFYK